MLDAHPVLKDRLYAAATFSGIAIAAVAGFDMVISGGFDFLTPGREVREVAPSAYVTVYREPWSPEARVVALSSNEPLFAGEVQYTSDRLVGGYDDAAAPDGASYSYPAPSEDELYRNIEALYAAQDAAVEQRGQVEYEPVSYSEDPYVASAEAAYAQPQSFESNPKEE
jgi:hypothetical protein